MSERAIIILSGGMDSITLLYKLKSENYNIIALTFNYGQKHKKEIVYAKYHCKKLGIKQIIINLEKFMKDYKSALINKNILIPNIKDVLGDPQPITYVPFRNQLFLTIACGVAESYSYENIFYGAQLHDLYAYWDTTSEFIEKINELISLNRKFRIQIIAPFSNYKKSNILLIGNELGVDYSKTLSCYNGNEPPCLKCPTCAERLKAFREIMLIDPLTFL